MRVEVRGQLNESWFSLSSMWIPGDQTQVVELGRKRRYLQSHFAGSLAVSFIIIALFSIFMIGSKVGNLFLL